MSLITLNSQGLRPTSINTVQLPRRQLCFPSPLDWRDEILYFLLPDRFNDGLEATRSVYERANPSAARPAGFRWDQWRDSGNDRFQGGNLKGVKSQLNYIKNLGATSIWIGPVLKQRGHLDTYHGYAIQDFLEVDPRFGNRADLVDLVATAHGMGLRVILDIIFNHSGHNWDYANGEIDPAYRAWPDYYEKGQWIAGDGTPLPGTNPIAADDGVWPQELWKDNAYTRAGKGDLSGEDIDDNNASIKRSDFEGSFRDFNFDGSNALSDLARCYKYWIALTDCDGFRLDTLKHVPEEVARNFCGTVKEFASNLGKLNFFLVGEVGGPDSNPDRYLDVLELNLNATLDIGPSRRALHNVAKGLIPPSEYFRLIEDWKPILGSHRDSGPRHVTILDDHDHVSGEKLRFSAAAASDHQVVVGVAIQFFTLGIPCVYYGTEQSFAGPEETQRQYLPDFGRETKTDRYLRECMFGALHPRLSGRSGILPSGVDINLPGFGAFGSTGMHFFDQSFHVYRRIQELARIRGRYPVLRYGRQYQRQISNFEAAFTLPGAGELIAWSRILDDEEALCVANGHGKDARGGDVIVSSELNSADGGFLQVVLNSAETANGNYSGPHKVGERIPVQFRNGAAYVSIRCLQPSEILVLSNQP